MAESTRARRDQLRTALVDIAELWVAEGGLERLKARPLAQAAGCSVGAIYTVFGDLTELTLAVNARTFVRLGRAVSEAVAALPDASALDRLVTMGRAYLAFAADNPLAWRARFELRMDDPAIVPDWYVTELRALFAIIAAPLRERFPDASDAEIGLLTRTLFSSVHGIVLLGLESRLSAVPREALDDMIALAIRRMATKA